MAKRFLIGLLAAILLIFPGCHKEIDDVLGQWRAELDIKTVLFQRLEKECPGISNVMAIEKLPVTLVLTFYADGTYQAQLDQQSVFDACQEAMPALEQGIWDHWRNLYARQAPGGDLETYLQSLGVTRQELMEEVLGDTLAQELILEIGLSQEGNFTVEKGKLRFSRSLEEAPEEESFHTYRVKGKTLTISPGEYSFSQDESYYAEKFPLSFQKSK